MAGGAQGDGLSPPLRRVLGAPPRDGGLISAREGRCARANRHRERSKGGFKCAMAFDSPGLYGTVAVTHGFGVAWRHPATESRLGGIGDEPWALLPIGPRDQPIDRRQPRLVNLLAAVSSPTDLTDQSPISKMPASREYCKWRKKPTGRCYAHTLPGRPEEHWQDPFHHLRNVSQRAARCGDGYTPHSISHCGFYGPVARQAIRASEN